ncbi:MAG: hypothetical protein AAFY01_00755 [Pseudomonadota bacterium]
MAGCPFEVRVGGKMRERLRGGKRRVAPMRQMLRESGLDKL